MATIGTKPTRPPPALPGDGCVLLSAFNAVWTTFIAGVNINGLAFAGSKRRA